jgi:hypothetical protein
MHVTCDIVKRYLDILVLARKRHYVVEELCISLWQYCIEALCQRGTMPKRHYAKEALCHKDLDIMAFLLTTNLVKLVSSKLQSTENFLDEV